MLYIVQNSCIQQMQKYSAKNVINKGGPGLPMRFSIWQGGAGEGGYAIPQYLQQLFLGH